jgi:hypothetical protein
VWAYLTGLGVGDHNACLNRFELHPALLRGSATGLICPGLWPAQYACAEYHIKNIDQVDGNIDTTGQWVGADGKAESIAGILGNGCDFIGMEDPLTDAPDPKPGQYVLGSEVYDVPTNQAGAIVVGDQEDVPLFRINYAPKSAVVKIAQ